jgi:ABC-type antimicrobial peptide transport system permease subunit
MGSVWLGLRVDARLRWRALVGLALLLGLIGGVVLAAAAGARRTDTAYPRLLRGANAAQVLIFPTGTSPGEFSGALRHLPQVASMSTAYLYQTVIPVRRGLPQTAVNAFSSPDGTLGLSADRVKLVQGRMFSPESHAEAVIDRQLADLEHLRPGGTLHLLGVPNDPRTGSPEVRLAVPLAFRVSAIAVFDTQIVPATTTSSGPTVLLSPSFSRTHAARAFFYGEQAGVRLRPGASMPAFLRAASTLAKRYPATGSLLAVNLADEVAATGRAIRPEAVALAVFAVLAGLIALAVIAQLLSRQLILDAAEFPILRALGMTRARLAALSLARMAVVTVAGGVFAVAVAIAASPLMPIGAARIAEPDPGIEVNLAVLGAGLAAIVVLPLALLAPVAWRAAAQAQGPLGVAEPEAAMRASRLGSALGRAGSVTSGVGARMALEPGRGRTAVPVRSALVGTTVAVAAAVAALVFGASFIALVNTPHRYGQNWSQELDLGFGGVPARLGAKVLSAEPAVTGWAGGNYGPVSVNGKTVAAIGIDPVRGRGFLTILAGRAPSAPGEIVLGTQTMRAVRRQLGQTVPVVANGTRRTMRIVGVAVFASFSRGGFAATDLGNGAAVPASVLSVRSTPSATSACRTTATCYNFFLIRYKPGTNLRAAAARLTAAVHASGCPPGPVSCSVITDQRPSDIQNYTGVRDTPLALGAVVALLAAGTLAHVLLTSVHRRRRDLAILKALGLSRSQLLRVVAWEASALAAVALLIGLPLGAVAGRWSWVLFARSVGVASQASFPVPLLLLAIPAALLLANLIAAAPGWTAAQVRPARILRSE